jgi:hypothetical protein
MVDIRTQLMEGRRDLPRHGEVRATENPSLPFVVVDAAGDVVEPVTRFLRELVLSDRSVLTCRSYAVDLLRSWRLLDVLPVGWDRATTDEVAVLVGWLRAAPNRQRTRRPPSRRVAVGSCDVLAVGRVAWGLLTAQGAHVSTVIEFSPLAVNGSPRWRSRFLPAGGHAGSPYAVMVLPTLVR